MKPSLWLAALFSAILLTTGTYAQDEPNPLIGSHLYRSYCFVCHGVDGGSGGPIAKNLDLDPADLSSERYQKTKVENLATLIGGYRRREESNMPNWSMVLTRADLLDIAAYITVMTQKDLRFRGDTRRGRAIFKRACAACHGTIGEGKGLLAHQIGISMMDFTKSENMKKLSDEDLIVFVRDGSGDYMPSWKGILSDSEIADVASYVRMLAR
ncbi:MAG: cytochrome c [Rhodospirillales bacterium]|nr:cytochrome c [Rhodospirillales bacterium]MDH3912895.1 cytochrome c [Rhodospirillales bacterium]MDH3967122.1 cytochrome c [Rhodospirillales bacterium]